MTPRYSVGILGATGAVGQKFVRLLDGHPWFRVTALAGSPRSQGRPYGEVVRWLEPTPLPAWAEHLTVSPPTPGLPCDFVFSAMDSPVAREVEPRWVQAGYPVFTNASPARMAPNVPLLVPEVNPDHVGMLEREPRAAGFIVANPNCSTTGLVMALKPLSDAFGLRKAQVTTLQAASGAGYPGVSSIDLMGNVLPHIPGEEEKLESEPKKIFGRYTAGGIDTAHFTISAQANRVPVVDGHVLSVSVGLGSPASVKDAEEAFKAFGNPLQGRDLPSAAAKPIVFSAREGYPQPRLHGGLGGGMAVSVGTLKPCKVLDLRFVALVHNTVRGAAGGAILNAEFVASEGFLDSKADSGRTMASVSA